jgi:hypothetical protein
MKDALSTAIPFVQDVEKEKARNKICTHEDENS